MSSVGSRKDDCRCVLWKWMFPSAGDRSGSVVSNVFLFLDFLKDYHCTINIASRVLSVGGSQLRLLLVIGD